MTDRSSGSRRSFMLFAAGIVGSFALLRISLAFRPNADFDVLGYNIHHLFTGILVVCACAIPLALDRSAGRTRELFVAGLGVGLGMVLDEWVYLIATGGSNAEYLLPVSFWGGVVCIVAALLYAWAWSRSSAR